MFLSTLYFMVTVFLYPLLPFNLKDKSLQCNIYHSIFINNWMIHHCGMHLNAV